MTKQYFLIALLALFFLSSCYKKETDVNNKYQNKKVLCIVKTMDNPYFNEMVNGFKFASTKSPYKYSLIIRSGSAEGDVNGQRQILESFFLEEVEGKQDPNIIAIVMTPASSGDALTPVIKKYRDKNIPVIIVDTPISVEALKKASTNITSFIASDNKGGAIKAAKELYPFLKEDCSILLLNGLDGHETAGLRRQGFIEGLKNSGLKNYRLTERTCDWERNKARETVDALLSVGNKYDAIFAANDQMAIGAIEAFKQHKIKPSSLPIIGFDAIQDAKKYVDDGELFATMQQNPEGMGKIAIKIVDDLIEANSVQHDIFIDVLPYKKTR